MSELKKQIDEAVAAIRSRSTLQPEWAIVLGTGLGGLVDSIDVQVELPFESIPHFVGSTAVGHKGRLILGRLEGRPVAAMDGRFHAYEGYSMAQIVFPVRVAKGLGARALVVSNACGAMNPLFRRGDLMVIDDHINLMGMNPLVGPNDDSLGPRFPDMVAPYDAELIRAAEEVAIEHKLPLRKGVYVAVLGPNLETRAEYRFLRAIGADVVGMSTVPEVLVGVHAGLRIVGFSIVTDMGLPDNLHPVDIAEILRVAAEAEPKLTSLVRGVVKRARI
jgi:purine-nucleoside phosphorylase